MGRVYAQGRLNHVLIVDASGNLLKSSAVAVEHYSARVLEAKYILPADLVLVACLGCDTLLETCQ